MKKIITFMQVICGIGIYGAIGGADNGGDFNTIAGLILLLLDRIPKVGDECTWRSFRFRVIEMDANRIDKILVTRLSDSSEESL